MARIRSVKPEFFHHEGLASCSPHARLLFVARDAYEVVSRPHQELSEGVKL